MDIKATIKKYGTVFGIMEILVVLITTFFMPMGVLLLVQPVFWFVSLVVSGILSYNVFKYWNKIFGSSEDT